MRGTHLHAQHGHFQVLAPVGPVFRDGHGARLQRSDPLQLLDAVGQQAPVGRRRRAVLGQHLLGHALVHPAGRRQAECVDQVGNAQHGQPPTRARARCSTRALRRA